MNIAIKALGIEPFPISNEIPEGLTGYYIPGTKILSVVAAFGKFMLQLAEFDNYCWLYYIFIIEQDVTFLLTYSAPLILARISLKGDFNYKVKAPGNLLIKENQFNIIYSCEASNLLHFTKGEYILFEAVYPQNLTLQTLKFFPAFKDLETNILQSKFSLLSDNVINVTASIAECIYKIIHSPFSENVRQFHVNVVKDLLANMLKEASSYQSRNNKFAIDEIERIYAAKEFIELNIPKHYSISQIARHAGLNEKKLKRGFKEIFCIGLYGYFRDRVIEFAKIEIEQTLYSIKEIAFHAGYKNANNFSTAFQKKFGISPLEWRKRFNDNKEKLE